MEDQCPTSARCRHARNQYYKRSKRLAISLLNGSFQHFSPYRKQTALRAIARYENQLRQWGIAVTAAAALLLPATIKAQPIPAGSEFRANTWTTNNQFSPSVAMDSDGDFVVVWYSFGQDGNGYGIYAQRYNSAGVAQGAEFRVNTWTTNAQAYPSVSMDSDGDFVVAWQSLIQDGSSNGIYAQRYNSAGVVQGAEFRVNTWTTSAQTAPSVAMDSDGDFVVAWQSGGQDGSGYGIYAQQYNSAGVAQGAEFRVNTWTTYGQISPSVAMDSDGDFVVTWESRLQDISLYGVYAQRYNSAGMAQGGEFRVNTWMVNNQEIPSVAMDSDGDFVVVWYSAGQDGSYSGIYAQQYNSAGVAQGAEFRVNTWTTNDQSFPSVAMDSDGNFVVVWLSYQDGGGYGIYAQQYNSAGVAQGGEFRVNTWTTNHQSFPSVAMDSDGDFVVAWQSDGQDGSGNGIYAQRYHNPLFPVELTIFRGEAMPEANLLEWHTASERNNEGFEIQRSANGSDFEAIGFVPGHGTVQSPRDYRFTDAHPLPGIQYYRLRQTDYGGAYTFSDIIVLHTITDGTFAVYPNPAGDILYISGTREAVVLYNSLGQPLQRIIPQEATSAIDISRLLPGLYWIASGGQRLSVVKR